MPKHRTKSATVRAASTVVAALAVALLTPTPALAQAASAKDPVAAFLADHPDATRVSSNQVSWHDGDVVLTFPGRLLPRLTSTCYSGWSCLYEHSDFGGRKLQFRSCGYTQSLGPYGFANAASSWVNRRSAAAVVRDSGALLWTEPRHSSSRYVGSAANDRADTIYLAC